jgi:DNA-binding MarR family transcriptional regulator
MAAKVQIQRLFEPPRNGRFMEANWQFTLFTSPTGETPPTVSLIAEDLDMDRTTTTKNLRPLERGGLVEIRSNPEDRRARHAFLTAAGRDLLGEALIHWRRVNRLVPAALPTEEVAGLRASLDAIAERSPPVR